jgi:hypothetical protein
VQFVREATPTIFVALESGFLEGVEVASVDKILEFVWRGDGTNFIDI